MQDIFKNEKEKIQEFLELFLSEVYKKDKNKILSIIKYSIETILSFLIFLLLLLELYVLF